MFAPYRHVPKHVVACARESETGARYLHFHFRMISKNEINLFTIIQTHYFIRCWMAIFRRLFEFGGQKSLFIMICEKYIRMTHMIQVNEYV